MLIPYEVLNTNFSMVVQNWKLERMVRYKLKYEKLGENITVKPSAGIKLMSITGTLSRPEDLFC